MRTLRQIHLYFGCIFAPLIIYFSLSGAWQVFRLNDIPKNDPLSPPSRTSMMHSIFHELSKPHTSSTLPGSNPKTEHSVAFTWLALLLALGMTLTTSIGIVLALTYGRSPRIVALCMGMGVALPVCLLILR